MRTRAHWILALLAAIALAAFTTTGRAADDKKDDDDETEVEVKFSDLPAAVQATFKKESGGAKIDTVEKITQSGETFYEADVTIDGKEWEIQVSLEGKLLNKKQEDDEGDKEDEKTEKK